MCNCNTHHHCDIHGVEIAIPQWMSEVYNFRADDGSERLDEYGYRDIMGNIEKNNVAGRRLNKLPFRDWAPLIPSVHYKGYAKNVMQFLVPGKWNAWETYIQFDEWAEQVADTSVTPDEAARLLFWAGNIRVHCPCPSFSFWGFRYIMTTRDAAMFPETRFPRIRNPQLKGVVCKHLIKTLKVLPFHLADMATAIRQQRAAKHRRQPPPAPEIR